MKNVGHALAHSAPGHFLSNLSKAGKWITHVRDATVTTYDGHPCKGGNSICCTCGKKMPGLWDTVCKECGGTFCVHCATQGPVYYFCLPHAPDPHAISIATMIKMREK